MTRSAGSVVWVMRCLRLLRERDPSSLPFGVDTLILMGEPEPARYRQDEGIWRSSRAVIMAGVSFDTCHVLVLSASLRAESLNTQLARLAAETIDAGGHVAELATMREFDVVPYDSDEEHAVGLPAGAEQLRRRIEAAHAFVIVSPEYNGSMPGGLKNAIDWVSRSRPQPFNGNRGCCCQRRRRWQAATAGSGPFGCRWSTSARGCIRTCSRWRRRTHAFDGDRLANAAFRSASRRRSKASCDSPRRRSSTRG